MPHKLGISSMSLGRAWVHPLPHKLLSASLNSFTGIEIFHEDLLYHADALFPNASDPHAAQLAAAHDIRHLCKTLHLTIINLQPFSQYDGLVDRAAHADRIKELEHWFALAHALGTDLIQVPASFLPKAQCSGDMDLIVKDLQEISDMGAKQNPPFRFAYEALCWSTHIDTWEKSWEVVQKVDRENFGLCLDTFNIAGRIYADPSAESGKTVDADEAVKQSIKTMLEIVDVKKVFFIQIVDAERLDAPLVEGHAYYDAEQPCRMSWSRNCRLFYGESDRGAYLPVRAITDAIINGLGFQGWVSMELFNRSMADPSPSTPEDHAKRGAAAWWKMVEEIGLDIRDEAVDSPLALDKTPYQHDHIVERVEKLAEPQRMSVL